LLGAGAPYEPRVGPQPGVRPGCSRARAPGRRRSLRRQRGGSAVPWCPHGLQPSCGSTRGRSTSSPNTP